MKETYIGLVKLGISSQMFDLKLIDSRDFFKHDIFPFIQFIFVVVYVIKLTLTFPF